MVLNRVLALAVSMALVIAACGSDDATPAENSSMQAAPTTSPGPATSTTTPGSTSTSTTAPPPTTTIAPTTTAAPVVATTTTAPPPVCDDSDPVAGDATAFESVAADFDLDGAPDQLQTYFVPSDNRWRIRYLPGAGGSFDEEISDSGPVGASRPVGGYDVDGDGPLEAFVVVGSGASAVLVGLYDVGACTVTRVTLDGVAASFPVGASIGNISGLTCQGLGDIDTLFASAAGGGAYEGGFSPHDLAGSVLTAGFGDGAGWDSFDEAASAVSGFDCPPLSL